MRRDGEALRLGAGLAEAPHAHKVPMKPTQFISAGRPIICFYKHKAGLVLAMVAVITSEHFLRHHAILADIGPTR